MTCFEGARRSRRFDAPCYDTPEARAPRKLGHCPPPPVCLLRLTEERVIIRGSFSTHKLLGSAGRKLCNSPAMRFVILIMVTGALLSAGCNSKTPPAQSRDESETERTADARPAFRNRAVTSQSETNQLTAATNTIASSTKKRMTIQALVANQTAAVGASEQADENSTPETTATPVRPEDIPQEGDEVLVPPQLLGALIPGANFESIQRKEPINAKSLLDSLFEQKGITLTNYQQLVEMGLTNYQIVRAQKPVTAETKQ